MRILRYNLFGEAFYPKNSVEIKLCEELTVDQVCERVRHLLETHSNATSLQIILPRLAEEKVPA
jgi:hypothetical protein